MVIIDARWRRNIEKCKTETFSNESKLSVKTKEEEEEGEEYERSNYVRVKWSVRAIGPADWFRINQHTRRKSEYDVGRPNVRQCNGESELVSEWLNRNKAEEKIVATEEIVQNERKR